MPLTKLEALLALLVCALVFACGAFAGYTTELLRTAERAHSQPQPPQPCRQRLPFVKALRPTDFVSLCRHKPHFYS